MRMMMLLLCNQNKAFFCEIDLLSVQHLWQSGFDGCVCMLDTKHTGYVVFVWVTSSFLLRFLIEWKSRVCGLQITFCSWCKTTISLIRMYICGYIYLIDIFVGHDDYIEYEASALPIHTSTNILIRILIYRRR